MSVEAPSPPLAPEKLRGLAHLFAAGRYSFAGFLRLLDEAAFRHEIALGAGLVVGLAAAGARSPRFSSRACCFWCSRRRRRSTPRSS